MHPAEKFAIPEREQAHANGTPADGALAEATVMNWQAPTVLRRLRADALRSSDCPPRM
ncbi:MAG: hypothetical protein AAFP18_08240 [Bacteroidota bacterium]